MQAADEQRGGGDSGNEEGRFHAAADHLAQLVSTNPSAVPDALKLRLYGLYKQATAGPCAAPRPRFWDRSACAKWNAWHGLGALPQQDAMRQYVEALRQHDPGWQPPSSGGAAAGAAAARRGGVGGPVFSTLALGDPRGEEQAGAGGGGGALHELAGQGNLAALRAQLDGGAEVDARDCSGCTPLHFAADRGRAEAVGLLLDAGADVNARDEDGQTPLHYAALCERQKAARLLLQRGADAALADAEGQTARQLAPSGWDLWERPS